MKPSPLSVLIHNHLQGLRRILAFIIFLSSLSIHPNSFAQRKYYEYNNPDVMKVGKDVIAKLTTHEWEVNDVRWLIRQDTLDYGGRGASLDLKDNGTYKSGRSEGTWQIKYDRYLVLTEINNAQQTYGGISGTFGVTSLTDSTLVLQKIHTSTRDMSKTITFVKHGTGDKQQPRLALDGRTPDEIRRLNAEWRSNAEWRQRDETHFRALMDSLKFLSKEELAFLGYRESNDTLFFDTSYSVYKVRLERHNSLRKVKIFNENEDVPDLEAYRRFTLPQDLIPLVDSLAIKFIREHREDYAPQKEIFLANYFRQYAGYFDINGDTIVLLNAFCQYKNGWTNSLVQARLGGVCYFNISINLSRKEAFSFHVNDF